MASVKALRNSSTICSAAELFDTTMTNCLLYALSLYMRRASKGRPGYIAVRRSRFGRFPHFIYIEQRRAMRIISYVPIDPRRKTCPPPLFRGRVRWGDG